MSTAPRGRRTGGLHRPPAKGRARITVHGLAGALRRPLVWAAVVLAVPGVSTASSSEAASRAASDASLTTGPMAVARTVQHAHNEDHGDLALGAALRLSAQRAPQVAHDQLAKRARAQAKAAMDMARVVADTRAARAQARQGLLGRAQSDPRSVGRLMVADLGWGGEQFACLDSLWTKESGWSWSANNSGSGAYGIPQALPGSKMVSSGSDWATNPITQISWGLGYIRRSYGTPCSAWGHSQANNWY